MEHQKNNMRDIAIAIVVAGVLIAGAILLKGDSGSAPQANGDIPKIEDMRGIEKDDHIMGNPKAKLTIVEFSDFECPFCARIHPTLKRLVEERTDVNWVYRHLPLTQIHSNAVGSAIASECVAELAGNDAFWKFADVIFNNQSTLSTELYEAEAVKLGINAQKFQTCLDSEKASKSVQEDSDEAIKIGGRGTPFSVIITPKGEYVPFSGAIPYENILQLVNDNIKK